MVTIKIMQMTASWKFVPSTKGGEDTFSRQSMSIELSREELKKEKEITCATPVVTTFVIFTENGTIITSERIHTHIPR